MQVISTQVMWNRFSWDELQPVNWIWIMVTNQNDLYSVYAYLMM